MTSGICFKFDISHHTVIVLLVLGATIVVLLIAQVPLLQVLWQGSKLVLRCCSGHLVPTVFAQELQFWDSYQLPWCKMVVNRDCAVQSPKKWSCEVVGSHQFSQGDPGLCWGSSGILIVDLSFHAQRHLLLVRRQLPCSDGFASPGSHHSSFADRTGATATGVMAKFQNCSSKLFSAFCRFESVSLQQRRLHKNFNLETAASYHGQTWSQIEIVQCKLRSCR